MARLAPIPAAAVPVPPGSSKPKFPVASIFLVEPRSPVSRGVRKTRSPATPSRPVPVLVMAEDAPKVTAEYPAMEKSFEPRMARVVSKIKWPAEIGGAETGATALSFPRKSSPARTVTGAPALS